MPVKEMIVRIIVSQYAPTSNPSRIRVVLTDEAGRYTLMTPLVDSSQVDVVYDAVEYLLSLTPLALPTASPRGGEGGVGDDLAGMMGWLLSGCPDAVISPVAPTVVCVDLPGMTPAVFWTVWEAHVARVRDRYTQVTGLSWPPGGVEAAVLMFLGWCTYQGYDPVKTIGGRVGDGPVVAVTYTPSGQYLMVTSPEVGMTSPGDTELVGFLEHLLATVP